MPLKFIPTNVKYNDSGEFKNISIPADRAYMNEAITVSSTQPTSSDNKLWINTNEQTKQTYQIPTMTDMETADNTILGNLATIESSPATAAHAVGEYIVYNGQLYKVTAAIAAGQTLTVGTNIAATDTATAIKNSIAVNNTQASFLISSIDASSLRSGRTGNVLMVTGWLRSTSDIAANTEFLDVGFNPKNAIYYGILHTSPGNVYLVQLNGTRARVNATLAANSFYNFCIIAFV